MIFPFHRTINAKLRVRGPSWLYFRMSKSMVPRVYETIIFHINCFLNIRPTCNLWTEYPASFVARVVHEAATSCQSDLWYLPDKAAGLGVRILLILDTVDATWYLLHELHVLHLLRARGTGGMANWDRVRGELINIDACLFWTPKPRMFLNYASLVPSCNFIFRFCICSYFTIHVINETWNVEMVAVLTDRTFVSCKYSFAFESFFLYNFFTISGFRSVNFQQLYGSTTHKFCVPLKHHIFTDIATLVYHLW